MRCNDCGEVVICGGGEEVCIDCPLFWPTDGPDGDELAAAEAGAAACDDND